MKPSDYEQATIGNFTADNRTWRNILYYAPHTAAGALILAVLVGMTA